jgi:hypothetical protein
MATLKEYYLTDFANAFTRQLSFQIRPDSSNYKIDAKVGIDAYSGATFIAYYVPHHHDYQALIQQLITGRQNALDQIRDLDINFRFSADIQVGLTGSLQAVFSNRIFVYTENDLNDSDTATLDALSKEQSISLVLRGKAYLQTKLQIERPLAFISHDSRDKSEIAVPIALGLQKLMCPVWFDEYSLKVGDNLRESIERGLKETRKCILILSPHFLSNPGWPKVEFDSVFTREIVERSGVVLPIWHKVSAKEVSEYSPSLANKKALDWSIGSELVVRRLHSVIMAQ